MLFTTYGNRNNPAVILMHGMCQDWHSMYDFLHDLEAVYYLIVPGMDGFYDGSGEFTTFADQCRQIEDYVNETMMIRFMAFMVYRRGQLFYPSCLQEIELVLKKPFLMVPMLLIKGKLQD